MTRSDSARRLPPFSKSFVSKADAAARARDQEQAVDRVELPASARDVKGMIQPIRSTITTDRRSNQARDRPRTVPDTNPSGSFSARVVSTGKPLAAAARHRHDRLRMIRSGTARCELAILQHTLTAGQGRQPRGWRMRRPDKREEPDGRTARLMSLPEREDQKSRWLTAKSAPSSSSNLNRRGCVSGKLSVAPAPSHPNDSHAP